MASPVSFTVTSASGTATYLGRARPVVAPNPAGLPSWVPAAGTLGNISLNTISSVYDINNADTFLRGSPAILNAWCSTCYAKDYGTYGSILAFGGGHQDYLGNEVYRYDIYNRLWSRITDGTPVPIRIQDFDSVAGNEYGEFWTSTAKTAVIVGKPAPPHTYGNLKYVPAVDAGNTNGWLILFGGFSFQAHKVDLDNLAAGWSRFGPLMNTVTTQAMSYGCTVYDSFRKRLFGFPLNNAPQSTASVLSVPAGAFSNPGQDYIDSYYTVGMYDAADDLYFISKLTSSAGRWNLSVHDPVTGVKHLPPSSGQVPTNLEYGGGTITWIESTRQLVYIPIDNNKVFFAAAPANPRTGTWVWSMQTLGGVLNVSGPNPMYERLHYVPQINSLMYVGQTTTAVQCFQLTN